jgi:hypothetical protein
MLHWSHVASYARGFSFLWWPSLTISLHLYSGKQLTTHTEPISLTFSKDQIDKFYKDLQIQQDRKSWVRHFHPSKAKLIPHSNAKSSLN